MKNRPLLMGILCGSVGAVTASIAMTQALNGNPWPMVLVLSIWVVLLTYVIRTRPRRR